MLSPSLVPLSDRWRPRRVQGAALPELELESGLGFRLVVTLLAVADAAGSGGGRPAGGRVSASHHPARLPTRPGRQPPQARDLHLCGGGGAAPLVRRRPGAAPDLCAGILKFVDI